MRGLWFDRSQEYEARRSNKRFGRYEFAEEVELPLSPLPVWEQLTAEEIRERVAEMVHSIEAETRRRIRKIDRSPLGIRRILKQDPHAAPMRVKRSPAPRFHAHRPAVRKGLELAHLAFRVAFRQAAEEPRAGKIDAEFPAWSFPPQLPFVRGRPALGVG